MLDKGLVSNINNFFQLHQMPYEKSTAIRAAGIS